ncbi:MAG: hypothetical protein WKG00_03930 [Polyangiaceae bacterium]
MPKPRFLASRSFDDRATGSSVDRRASRSPVDVYRVLKHLLAILSVIVVLGCGGGAGCSSCAGCGVTPLPEGFDPAARVENAGAARITQSGFTFLQQNLAPLAKTLLGGDSPDGSLTFEVPESKGKIDNPIPFLPDIDYTICPGGPDAAANPPKCTAEIGVGDSNLVLTPEGPHNLKITGTMPLRLQYLPMDSDLGGMDITLSGNQSCPGDPSEYAQIPIRVNLSIESNKDTSQSFHGYSRVRIEEFWVDKNAIENSIEFCGGLIADIAGFLKGFVVDFAYDALIGTLGEQIEQQLCRQANPALDPPCPSGTNDVNGVCRYGTDESAACASIVLGTDGHADLGALLASISAGTKGGLDFLFAAGGHSDAGGGLTYGDLNPVANGATIGLYGGSEPKPISKCVKFSEAALPTGIPLPDELLGNTVTGWPTADGPHVGIAVSERFANYALAGMYNSGLLCLGISTETVDLLNSGTLSLLIPSLTSLALQRETQQVALMVRPGEPPTVVFGNGTNLETDPSMRVRMNNASFDFYIFSLDRFVRFMTATFDLDVPINLAVTPDGLQPVLDKIGVSNGKITNAELLNESEDALVGALQDLITSQVGSALGGIAAIDLNSSLASLGLTLTIPESVEGAGSPGLRRLEKGSDGYLGIFAGLGVAPAMAQQQQQKVDTEIALGDKHIDPAGLVARTRTDDNMPSVTVLLDSPADSGAQPVEYSYRIDGGAWKPFSTQRILTVRDPAFRLQGRHLLEARARIAGQPMTLDDTPAVTEIVIDAESPRVEIGPVDAGKVTLTARDVSGTVDAMVRTRLGDGAWSQWAPFEGAEVVTVGDSDDDLEVEVKDASGNIGTASQAIIRGKPSAAAGCNCAVTGDRSAPPGMLWLLGAALFGIAARVRKARDRMRRAASAASRGAARHAVVASALCVAAGMSGCSCGDDGDDPGKQSGSAGDYSCKDPCQPLSPGLSGAYTSAAVASDGTVWVAGYLEGDLTRELQYGDLVVGKWNGESVDWTIVDGVPTDPPPNGEAWDLNGFRGGQDAPGDDVGLWTSIAINSAGVPAVAYYDRTNRQLKYAFQAGDGWDVSVVESIAGGDVGRYAKLVLDGDTALIAYSAVEPAKNGAVTSKVRFAKGTSDSWTFEDVAVDPATPCRKAYCTASDACVIETGLCTAIENGCDPACASGSECVTTADGVACTDVFADARVDSYPDVVGAYVSLALGDDGTLGIAFYDRIHGNVVVAAQSGGSWTTKIVDGQLADGTDTGDVGIGASLFIDGDGAWHLSYVDGWAESLKYARLADGAKDGGAAPEIETVDDGLTLAGAQFDDGQPGRRRPRVAVSGAGDVRITYQDATTGTLRYALGTAGGAGHTWEVSVVEQEGRFAAPSRRSRSTARSS